MTRHELGAKDPGIIRTNKTVYRYTAYPGRCSLASTVYTDGSGGSKSGFGYYVQETGYTFHEKKEGMTSNQAEYRAILSVLKAADPAEPLVIYSDSKNTVSQLNHEFAINDETLRDLAREAWPIMARFASLKIRWVPRAENPAGKMLGS